MRIDEKNFIEEMKKGNEKALAYVIDEYGWILKTVLRKHLFYLMDYYEDCLNECLLAAWEHIDQYDPQRSSFKNWLAGIAKYKAIDTIRKHIGDRQALDVENLELAGTDNPEEDLLAQELAEQVQDLLSFLPQEDQEIFYRFYFEDQGAEEIARATGRQVDNIYNRLSRGRKRLGQLAEQKGVSYEKRQGNL